MGERKAWAESPPHAIISSHLISSHCISSHLISSYLISSHLISSHLISSYKVVETSEQRQLREMAEAQAVLKANLRQVGSKISFILVNV